MHIADLYGRHKGQPIVIAGTGPSARVFPMSFLDDKVVIGLNQFWRYGRPTYSLTIHPELLVDYEKENGFKDHPTQWIVKKKPPLEKLTYDDPKYYVFSTKEDDYSVITEKPNDILFLSKGIQCTAIDLAARLGASCVFLVGVDMGELAGDHHGHDQHVRFLGLDSDLVYREMRHHTSLIRTYVREKLGIQVLTLSALLGTGAAEEDYKRLCAEFDKEKLPKPKDTSPYKRKIPKIPLV